MKWAVLLAANARVVGCKRTRGAVTARRNEMVTSCWVVRLRSKYPKVQDRPIAVQTTMPVPVFKRVLPVGMVRIHPPRPVLNAVKEGRRREGP